jgi:hypothetical protein
MSDSNDPWYRIGYALESARLRSPVKREPSDADRSKRRAPSIRTEALLDTLLSTSATALAGRVLGVLPGRSAPSSWRLIRAAVAGAGAATALAILRGAFRTEQNSSQPPDPTPEILAGTGRGILYGAVLEPHLPGSALMRGLTFGVLEYLVAPMGGLDEVLGAASPRRTIPVLGVLLGSDGFTAETLTENLVFGATLGVLYGEGRLRSGSAEAE